MRLIKQVCPDNRPKNPTERSIVVIMQLRDCPLMSYRGLNNWPPVWVQRLPNSTNKLRGEHGVLRYVHHVENIGALKIYLVIEHQAQHYIGTLLFGENPLFVTLLARWLRAQYGKLVSEIGAMEVEEIL